MTVEIGTSFAEFYEQTEALLDLGAAAKRYLDAKKQEKELIASTPKCERLDPIVDGLSLTFPGPCWKELEFVKDYCDACKASIPIAAEIRKVRRGHGGRMATMMRAWRKVK